MFWRFGFAVMDEMRSFGLLVWMRLNAVSEILIPHDRRKRPRTDLGQMRFIHGQFSIVNGRKMSVNEEQRISDLAEQVTRHFELRRNAVLGKLESPELAALMLEQYLRGSRDCANALLGRIPPGLSNDDINKIVSLINPKHSDTTVAKYQSFAKLDLSTPHS